MAKKRKIRFGMFPKMLIPMAVIAIVPLVVTWQINLKTTTDSIQLNVNKQLDELSTGLVNFVDTWVEMNLRMLRQNAATSQMRSMDPNKQEELLKLITKEYNWNYLAFTVDSYGQNIARSDGKALKFYGDRDYVKQVLRGGEYGSQVLISRTTGKPSLIISVPIRSGAEQLKGVLAIGMSIEQISEHVTKAKIGKTGHAFILDELGKIIAHQSPEFTKERKDLSDHPAFIASRSNTMELIYTDQKTGEKMVSVAQTTNFGWTLIAELPYNEAFAELSTINHKAVIFLVGTLIAVIIIAYLVARGLSIPIQKLTLTTEKLSRGEFNSKLRYTNRKDEIGALSRAIGLLATSNKILLQRMSSK